MQDSTCDIDTRWVTPTTICCITLTRLSRTARQTGLIVNGFLLGLRNFFLRGMTRVNSEPGFTLRKIEILL